MAAKDTIVSNLYVRLAHKNKDSKHDNICKFFFEYKAVELINLQHILHENVIQQSTFTLSAKCPVPTAITLFRNLPALISLILTKLLRI